MIINRIIIPKLSDINIIAKIFNICILLKIIMHYNERALPYLIKYTENNSIICMTITYNIY